MFVNKNYRPFEEKVWLAKPFMHGPEQTYMTEAYETNWMTTAGKNIEEVERLTAEKIGIKYCVGLSAGTAALHMALKLAGEAVYGKPKIGFGALFQKKVFCSDCTFDASCNPIVYEGGIPVFIDTEYETWNMDPEALAKAFKHYPEVKIVVIVHLYGTPAKMDEIKAVCDKNGAVMIEDAAESFGAVYRGRQTGSLGMAGCLSANGNKIITGTAGGMLVTNSFEASRKVKKWSTQSREDAPWYQHEELGYNYRMSNVVAGVLRGQFPYLEEHIALKKRIYERYKKGLEGLPVSMNPYDEKNSEPNFWLSCMLIKPEAMCKQVRGERDSCYVPEHGKSCPTEILEAMGFIRAEGRPIWKPMHMQPIYRRNEFIGREGSCLGSSSLDVGMDIFNRGLCLPSHVKMTGEEQNRIIEVIRACFE